MIGVQAGVFKRGKFKMSISVGRQIGGMIRGNKRGDDEIGNRFAVVRAIGIDVDCPG